MNEENEQENYDLPPQFEEKIKETFATKRKEAEDSVQDGPKSKQRKIYHFYKNQNPLPPQKDGEKTAEETTNIRDQIPPKGTQDIPNISPTPSNKYTEKINTKEGTVPPHSPKTTQENEDMITDWERRIKDHRKTLEREEKERRERLDKMENLEKSWELARLCRQFIRENSKNCK